MGVGEVQRWRNKTKIFLINSFGNKCIICGYNKCIEALDFHHINPNNKIDSISNMLRNPKNIKDIIIEASKCMIVCSNCHRELHSNIIQVSFEENILTEKQIEELVLSSKVLKKAETDVCPICGKEKSVYRKTCSLECAGKKRALINYSGKEILDMIKENSGNISQVGRLVGISDNGVRKRIMKALIETGISEIDIKTNSLRYYINLL